MTDTAVVFDIENAMVELTEEEASKVWKDQSRRASNFAAYQAKVNATAIGGHFKINIPKQANTDATLKLAREIKYNVNEAAKERVAMKPATLTTDEAAQFAANKKIDAFDRDDGSHIVRAKGQWFTQVTEPVVIRWRQDTHEEEVEVEKDGKKGKVKVNVPDLLYVLVQSLDSVKKRAKRTDNKNGPVVVVQQPTGETTSNGTTEPLTDPTIGQQAASVG